MKPLLALGAFLVLAGGRLAAQGIAYDGSFSGSTGKYFFTERTTNYVLTNGLAVRAGPFTFRASVPVWWRNTTLVTPTGVGPIPDGGSDGRDAVRDSGVVRKQRDGDGGGSGGSGTGGGGLGSGDGTGGGARGATPSATGVLLSASGEPAVPAPPQSLTGWDLAVADPTVQVGVRLPTGARVFASLSAAAKIPLADTSGIGTGEWDVGASAAVSVPLTSRLNAGLDASYWHLGDLPDFDFQDPVIGSASLGVMLGNRWAALASLTAGTSAIDGYDGPMWLGAAVSRYTRRGAFGLNLTVGLTESTPDVGAGVTWSIPIREIR